MKTCLECGTRLVARGQEGQKRNLRKLAGLAGIAAIIVVAACLAWFVVLPLLHYSMASGQGFSDTIRADAADQSAALPRYAMNQAIRNNELEVTVTRTREGTNVLNANRFYFVTVSIRNLKADRRIQVSGGDFVLVDGAGNSYYTYGIGNKVAQDLGPLESQSYELNYEIPRDTRGLTLQFWFPKTGAGTGANIPVIFTLS